MKEVWSEITANLSKKQLALALLWIGVFFVAAFFLVNSLAKSEKKETPSNTAHASLPHFKPIQTNFTS